MAKVYPEADELMIQLYADFADIHVYEWAYYVTQNVVL